MSHPTLVFYLCVVLSSGQTFPLGLASCCSVCRQVAVSEEVSLRNFILSLAAYYPLRSLCPVVCARAVKQIARIM